MTDKKKASIVLQETYDYLSQKDHWANGIGVTRGKPEDWEKENDFPARTCLLGGMHLSLTGELTDDTDEAIRVIEELDGQALSLLAQVCVDIDPGIEYLESESTKVYRFNDYSHNFARIGDALLRAIGKAKEAEETNANTTEG